MGGCLLLSAVYSLRRTPTLSADWLGRPVREAEVELIVQRTFHNRDPKTLSGVAIIEQCPSWMNEAVGLPVYYQYRVRKQDLVAPQLLPGTRFHIKGVVEALANLPARGSFQDSLMRSGIWLQITRGGGLRILDAPPRYERWRQETATRLSRMLLLGADLAPEEARTLCAIFLGDTSLLDKDRRDIYARTGTTHLFAISGLHVAVIAMALYQLLGLCRLPEFFRWGAGLAVLLFYVEVSGGAPSARRAFLMVAFVAVGRIFQRPGLALPALVAVALGELLIAPSLAYAVGFQLSYIVVAAILCYGCPMTQELRAGRHLWPGLAAEDQRFWQRVVRHGWLWITASVPVSLAAFLASIPWIAHYFGIFSTGSLFLNLLLVPISGLLIISAMGSVLAGVMFGSWGAMLFNRSGWVLAWSMNRVTDLADSIPGFHLSVIERFTWLGPLFGMLLLAVVLTGPHALGKRWQNLWWWLPPLLVAMYGLLGLTAP